MKRFVTGAIGILVMIPICLLSDTWIWPIALTFFSLIATDEILTCIGAKKEFAYCIPAFLYSFLPLLTWLFSEQWNISDMYRPIFLFTSSFILVEVILAVMKHKELSVERLCCLIALEVYVVFSATACCQLRYIDHGNEEGKYIYLLVYLGAWISDSFAYFAGRLFGKHKLAPEISPKKTVEGSIGGILANMAFFALYAFILRHFFNFHASYFFLILLGALFSVIGQFGDLFASCIKRYYGVKDFGRFFPGHGGVLDRFDSAFAIASVMLLVYTSFATKFLIS